MTIEDPLESNPSSPGADVAAAAPRTPDVEKPGALAVRRVVFGLCATLVLILVSHPISDPDTWQHLRVGEVMWRFHELPRVNVWTWPTLGATYDVPSWLFRVLLWPVWKALGSPGLFLWRWLTALSLVALLYAAARRASARRGEAWLLLAVITWGALFWHQRWQCRPETLVAPLLAAELILLESIRRRSTAVALFRDPVWLVVPLQILWINLHISYYLGLVVAFAFVLDALWRSTRDPSFPSAGRLALVSTVAAAACFINPFGWRAIWQPFHFFLHERTQLIYRVVDELQPLNWGQNVWNGLTLYLALMLALAVWRWRRVGFDAAQAVLLAVLLTQVIATQRFILLFTVATAPTFARDLADALERSSWWSQLRSPWTRATLALAPVVVLAVIEIGRAPPRFGQIVSWDRLPVRACDFMAEHDVRGRGYNMFWHGGYLLWRFWPDRGRLPFMDIHQTGTLADRELQVLSQADTAAWSALCRRYQFDWILLPTRQLLSQNLLDYVDADTSRWALVFADDAASLFLRRGGRGAVLAEQFGYRVMRLGDVRSVALGGQVLADSALHVPLALELDRAVSESPWNSRLLSLRATIALAERRWPEARRDLEAALRVNPRLERGYDRLAYALLMSGEPRRALLAIRRAKELGISDKATESLARQAQQMIGSGA